MTDQPARNLKLKRRCSLTSLTELRRHRYFAEQLSVRGAVFVQAIEFVTPEAREAQATLIALVRASI